MRRTILDDGHLRFFTEKSLDDLLLNAGFRMERIKLDERIAGEAARLVARCVPLARGEHARMLAERYAAADAELIRMRRGLLRYEREAERARTHLHFADTEMRRAQESYAASERALLAEREQCEGYARGLEAAERKKELAEQSERSHVVEVAELRVRAEALRARADAAEHEALQRENELTSLRANARAAEISESRLIGYAEAAAAEHQAESVRLGLLIDIVQSSRFWRLKRAIRRIFGRSRERGAGR
jgi:colicin import membrane protein